jgi:non-specific protein-tyrosine kinase
MDIRHRLRLFRAWARWIVAGTLIAAVAAYVISGTLPKVYEADARLVVGQALSSNNPAPDQFQTAQQLSAAYVALASDRPVLEAAIKRLGINMPIEDFADLVTVDSVRDLPFIDVVGRSDDPVQAAAFANAMAAELVALSPTLEGAQGELNQFVEDDMRAIEKQITEVRGEYDRLIAIRNRTATQELRLEVLAPRLVTLQSTYAQLLQYTTGSQANRIAIVQQAIPPIAPASPRPLLNVALASTLAFLLSIGAAFLWERLDDRIKTPEDLEEATGLAMIGLVAQMPGDKRRKAFYRLASLLYPRSPAAEAFRTIRTNIEFAALDRGLRTIVVTSSLPSEGKTVVASNLAVAFAQAGRRTILVDADLRRPGVSTIFGLPNEQGLTDLVRTDSVQIEDVAQVTEAPNLTVIAAGTIPANPAELLGSRRMLAIIERLKESADIVVFDTPPITAVTDAAIMAAKADGTIMVIQSHRASRRIVESGVEALTKVNARIVGAVLNNVPGHVAIPYYGRSHGDSQGSTDRPHIEVPPIARTADGTSEAREADDEALDSDATTRPARRGRSRSRTTTPRAATDLDGANR